MGDLEAQIASAELGVQRFQQLIGTYGKETVLQATKQLMDYTEGMLRREIAKIPDGDYVAEGFLDDDGRNRGVHLPIKVTVRVRGDGVEVDLTGSSPQVPTAFNVPFEGSTKVACFFAFRALLLDTYTQPNTSRRTRGRSGRSRSPRGIFNPTAPAAAEARFTRSSGWSTGSSRSPRCCPTSARLATRRCWPLPLFGRAAERRLLGLPRSERSVDGRLAILTAPTRSRS
jgi:N-methylhydantoinase B